MYVNNAHLKNVAVEEKVVVGPISKYRWAGNLCV